MKMKTALELKRGQKAKAYEDTENELDP